MVALPPPRKKADAMDFLDHAAAAWEKVGNWLWVPLAAVLGRLMYHANEVKHGRRAFWSVELAMDLLIAAGMGLIAWGGCVWGGLEGPPAAALIAVAGYLGPHALDVLFAKHTDTPLPPAPAGEREDDGPVAGNPPDTATPDQEPRP